MLSLDILELADLLYLRWIYTSICVASQNYYIDVLQHIRIAYSIQHYDIDIQSINVS